MTDYSSTELRKVFTMIKYKIIDFHISGTTNLFSALRTKFPVKLILHPTKTVDSESNVLLQQSSPSYAIDALLSIIKPGDSFIDFGCGKGEVIERVAAEKQLKTVVGVEISADLTLAAERYIQNCNRKYPVTIHNMDAALFTELDEITVAYFFHPFDSATFQAVMKNIWQSLQQKPRDFKIIYVSPLDHVFTVLYSLKSSKISHFTYLWEYFPNRGMNINTDIITTRRTIFSRLFSSIGRYTRKLWS